MRLIRDARRRHGAGYPGLVARFADAYFRRQYSLREITKLDLLDPRHSQDWFDANISKQGQLELQRRLNPAAYWVLTEDKDVFYRYCLGAGLPVPRYYGCITAFAAKDPQAATARLRQQAIDVLRHADAPRLIIKPAQGVYGRGVVSLSREQEHYRDGDGVLHTARDVPEWLGSGGEFDRFVVQERVAAHPAFEALSGTKNLQTVRMATYVRNDETPVVGCCQLKIIGGDSLVDNYGHGQRGNLIGDIPGARGRLSRAFKGAPDGSCIYVERHPRTGATFRDFAIPCWEDACALVKRAALAFRPLRTIGWDVAITPTGPLLIEGNASWDPPQRGDEVNAEILDVIRSDGACLAAQERALARVRSGAS